VIVTHSGVGLGHIATDKKCLVRTSRQSRESQPVNFVDA
jgi:hypothetical protein